MGHSTPFGLALLAGCWLGTAGVACGDDSESSGGSSASSSSSSGGGSSGSSSSSSSSGSDGGTDAGGGATFGSGTNFSSVDEFFDYVNGQRESYAPHDRYAGFPFTSGYYHTTVTWPYTMAWSDTAAALAQAEAEAVAGGAAPSGQETFANPGQLPLYIDGLNTADYVVGGRERPGSFTTETCTLCNSNGFARMGVFYHDPGGDGPVLTRLGIGAADMGNGDTWWVMKFEP
jgi:hypothetical protein